MHLIKKFKILWKFLDFSTRKLLVIGVALGVVLFGVELSFAFGLQVFLNELGLTDASVLSVPDWVPRNNLLRVVLFVFFVGAARGTLQWAQFFLQGYALEDFKYRQRRRMIDWIFRRDSVSLSQTASFFSEKTNNAGGAVMAVQGGAMQFTSSLLLGASLFAISWKLTLFVIPALVVIALPLRVLNRTIQESGTGLAEDWDRVQSHLMVSIKNLLLLQIYGTRSLESDKTQSALGSHRRHILKYYRFAGLKFAVPQVLGVGVVCYVTIYARSAEMFANGTLVTFFYVFLRFVQGLSETMKISAAFRLNWPQLEALIQWWKSAANVVQIPALSAERVRKPEGAQALGWKVCDMTFGYEDALWENLSLEVGSGETLVISGPSGSGKSSLLHVMIGNLKPQRGEVLIHRGDSWEPIDRCQAEVLGAIGYVGPESFLIEGTVRENLLYGVNRTPSDDEIREALELSECDFVLSSTEGLNRVITEQGQGLSAGQKQRLSLARALLRRPQALLLDEATSNLDSETENKLIHTLEKLKKRMTIIAITHRPSLKRLADRELDMGMTVRGRS